VKCWVSTSYNGYTRLTDWESRKVLKQQKFISSQLGGLQSKIKEPACTQVFSFCVFLWPLLCVYIYIIGVYSYKGTVGPSFITSFNLKDIIKDYLQMQSLWG
jgi:hypothetical protein